jgi:hypothetical protein
VPRVLYELMELPMKDVATVLYELMELHMKKNVPTVLYELMELPGKMCQGSCMGSWSCS